MKVCLTVNEIKKFKEDLLQMDVNLYMQFVMGLNSFEWKVLSLFMNGDFIYYFNTFVSIYKRYYKFINLRRFVYEKKN